MADDLFPALEITEVEFSRALTSSNEFSVTGPSPTTVQPGDTVTVELSPYDLTRGRITYRSK